MIDPRPGVATRQSEDGSDNVRIYLRELGAVPLLTREREVELARRMELGVRRVVRLLVLSPEARVEMRSIEDEIREGRGRAGGVDGDGGAGERLRAVRRALARIDANLAEIQALAGEARRTKPGGRLHRRAAWLSARQQVFASRELIRLQLDPSTLGRIAQAVLQDRSQPRRSLGIRRGLREIDQAKTMLIRSNLRLVVSIAKRYAHRGVGFLDLIQEGNLGLMRAVEKFEYRRGYKFSTYATWWVRQAVSRAIADQSRTIRVPVHMNELIFRIARTQEALVHSFGREPTRAEIARELRVPVAKVQNAMRAVQGAISLDGPLGHDDTFSVRDVVEDERDVSPFQHAARANLRQRTLSALACLTEREAKIIRMRFGVGGGRRFTLDEIGTAFTLTRERIRQIESKALAKLRDDATAAELRTYLAN